MAAIDIDGDRILITPDNDNEHARALQLNGSSPRKNGSVTLPLNTIGWYQVREEFPQDRHAYSEWIQWWRAREEDIASVGRATNNKSLETWDMPDLWLTQGQAVERILYGGSAIVADDRGMGKTRTIVEVLRRSPGTTAVIVTGKRLRSQWIADTARWWRPGLVVAPQGSTWSEAALEVGSKRITILTYDSILNDDIRQAVGDLNPDYLIVDEAHNVKKRARKNKKKDDDGNVISKTNTKSGALRSLPGRHRIALTGTPMPNVWHEIWALLNFVAPDAFGSFWHFVENLGSVEQSYWGGKDISKVIVRKDIWEELFDRWIISRNRPQTGKVWDFVPVELSKKEAKAYRQMAEEWRVEMDGQTLDASNHLARLIRLQQLAGGLGEWETTTDEDGKVVSSYKHADPSSKTDLLLEKLEGLDRAVVWTRYRDRAEYVTRRIANETDLEPLLISGGTTETATTLALARFSDPKQGPLVAVCVYGTISEGVNELVSASDVFFLDWTTAKDVTQAADRCDRPGQKRQVRCVTLYARGTVDELALDREAQKVRPLRSILRDPDAWKFLEEIPD